jgi:hypothetical protein
MAAWSFAKSVALFSVVVVLSSCGNDNSFAPQYPRPTRAVLDFVRSQEVPDLRSAEQYLLRGDIEAFVIEYGTPMDCESGCAYRSAYGLRVRSNVGWLKIWENDVFEPDSASYFDVSASNTALFDTALWTEMRDSAELNSFLWFGIFPVIARDVDAPVSALVDIAERLATNIVPYVAWQLLDNLVVQTNSQVLGILAALPVYQGNPYAGVRARARELLGL